MVKNVDVNAQQKAVDNAAISPMYLSNYPSPIVIRFQSSPIQKANDNCILSKCQQNLRKWLVDFSSIVTTKLRSYRSSQKHPLTVFADNHMMGTGGLRKTLRLRGSDYG
jgi:hypothetical protein